MYYRLLLPIGEGVDVHLLLQVELLQEFRVLFLHALGVIVLRPGENTSEHLFLSAVILLVADLDSGDVVIIGYSSP